MRMLYLSPDGVLTTTLQPEQIKTLLAAPGGFLWIDFPNGADESVAETLRSDFHFHPLAIEDALQQSHLAKVDNWNDYLYIVVHPISFHRDHADPVKIHELDIFVGPNYLVTHHEDQIAVIDHTWETCQRDERFLHNGTDFLLYKICDEIAASYLPIVEEIDGQIDVIEDLIFSDDEEAILSKIFQLKRSALKLRRVLAPEREVFNRLARDDYQVIRSQSQIYFRDIYDQLVLVHEIIESIRDLASGTLDTYLSVVNNRMNEAMKTLAVITTLFLPASFLASFFGMNFFQTFYPLKSWTSLPMFFFTLLLMATISVGILVWLKRRRWL
ncbi:MAG: magnesium/cobalt transporter CorA [Anaerolineales bacterium]|jgi:magnesium transporter